MRRVALVMPYPDAPARRVADYLDAAAARLEGRVTSAALCTARQIPRRLGLPVPDALPAVAWAT